MPKQTHLVKRGPRYGLRRKIPRNVAHLVQQNLDLWRALTAPGGGRREDWDILIGEQGQIKTLIWVSLMTSDHAEAAEAARAKDAMIDALCAEVRRTFEAAQTQPKRALGNQDVTQIAMLWLHRRESQLPESELCGVPDDVDEYLEVVRDDLGVSANFDDPSVMGWAFKEAKRLVTELGFDGKPGAAPFNQLALYIARCEVERLKRREARLQGRYDQKSFDRLFDSVDGVQEPDIAASPTVMTLTDLINHYLEDRARRGVREKSQVGYRVIFDILKELLGPDTPVNKINRETCRKIREILVSLPPNASKRFKGVKLADVIAKAKAEGIPGLSLKTQQNYLGNLTALFNYAVEEQFMETNPAKGLQDGLPKLSSKTRRVPFTTAQLQKIFNAPLYVGCRDDQNGYAFPGPNVIRRGRFWVPLLALFHGVRMNEACQLLVSDVVVSDGIATIKIQVNDEDAPDAPEENQKKLKTDAATRDIPLHPELVKMGFLRYWGDMRVRGENRLFPELTMAATGYLSDNFSKWFGHFLGKIGAKASRTSFHSFRHCFRDALRRADVSHDMVLLLGGWSGGGTDQDYGHGGELLPAKAKAIAKVEYPGLDLSHLYEQGS
ncbi:MAG: site-specific integrase [Magnetococcales bacterium]|nr:site-specific integrase [Magnetococcales bacterium]